MKKIFMAIAFAAILMIPFTSFAMTQIADSDLATLTGQSGVSINLDTRIDLNIGTVAWGDADGFILSNGDGNTSGETNSAGWVGLSGLVVSNLRIRADQTLLGTAYSNIQGALAFAGSTTLQGYIANYPTAVGTFIAAYNGGPGPGAPITSLSQADLVWASVNIAAAYTAYEGAYGAYSTAAPYYTAYGKYEAASAAFKPLTIDVATDVNGTLGYGTGTTFVRIGLGSLQVAMDSMTADVKVGSTNALGVGTLGSIFVGNMLVRIDGTSTVDIYAKNGTAVAPAQGVGIGLNILLDQVSFGTLAWGDKDGLGPAAAVTGTSLGMPYTYQIPGWVAGTTVGWVGLNNLNIAGMTVIGKVGIDVATDASNWTFVQIGLNALSINTGTITGTVAMGSSTTLNQELGNIYISGLNVTVNGNLQLGARADGTQGVTINLSNLSVAINGTSTISWGDTDGIGGTTTAGYVGLKNLAIVGLVLNGPVTIDVASISPAIVSPTQIWGSMNRLMYGTYESHYMSTSFVHIGFGGDAGSPALIGTNLQSGALGINIASLSADVAFGNTNSLATARTMGSFYLGNVVVGVNGWVDIAAH